MEEKANSFIEGVIIVCCIFTLVAGFVVSLVIYFNKRKTKFYREKKEMEELFAHELLKTQLETREEALNQIGEELHDHIGQLLSSTKLLLGITERKLTEIPDTLVTAQDTLGRAIQDIRSLSKALNKEWLNQFDLLENVEAEARRINAGGTVVVTLKRPDQPLPLNNDQQIILFRIIQEALQNSIKHAEAQKIEVGIILNGSLNIYIADDGKGFNADETSRSGVGLINMRRRARVIGGEMTIGSAAGKGTHTSIFIPNKKSIS